MCDPMTLALTAGGLQIGSGIMQYQNAKAQSKAQTAMYEMNQQNAYQAMRNDYMAVQQRQLQEQDAAAEQIAGRRLEALREVSTATVAAGESGVSGFSVERVLRDIGAVASRDISTIEQNRDWGTQQLQNELLGIKNTTVSRINSVSPGTKPNPWAYVFQTGADTAASGFTTYFGAGGTIGKTKTS